MNDERILKYGYVGFDSLIFNKFYIYSFVLFVDLCFDYIYLLCVYTSTCHKGMCLFNI